MLPLFNGRKVTSSGQISVLLRTAAIPASLQRSGGWAMDADGQPYIETAAVASTRVMNQGIAFTPDGAMYVTADAPSSTSIRTGGVAVSATGAVHFTTDDESLSGGIGLSSDGQIVLGNEATGVPQSELLFAEMDVQPNAARQALIQSTIRALINANIWNSLDVFYMLAAHDSQAASLNWKSPTVNQLGVSGTPTFTVDEGYTGDGISEHLTTGYNPSSSSFGMSQDDSHGSVFLLTDNTVAAGRPLTAGANFFISQTSTPTELIRTGDGTSSTSAAPVAAPVMITMCRADSATKRLRLNNSAVENFAVASTALAVVLTFLATSTGTAPADCQIAFGSVGRNLTDDQTLSYYSAVLAYLQGVGAV